MRYAINENGSVVFKDGETPFPPYSVSPIPEDFENIPKYQIKITDVGLILKTDEELRLEVLPLKYKNNIGLDEYGNQLWTEKTQEEKDAIDQAEQDAVDQTEIDWQNNKSQGLKILENIYIDFLTNMWTPILRASGLIANDYTITVDNTDEPTNMFHLIQLRSINYAQYDQMANEFLRLKMSIVGNGGIMSKVQLHS